MVAAIAHLRRLGAAPPVCAAVHAVLAGAAHRFERPPRLVYVVHAEPAPAASLAHAIEDDLGWRATVAEDGATVPLDPG